MRPLTLLLTATAIALFDLPATAQSQSFTPTIKTRVDLVLVPVIVRDTRGGHVRGLSAADFTLEDNGTRQKIASVEEVATDNQPLPSQAALTGSTFTNQVSSADQPKNLVIVALDRVNTPFLDQSQAREAVLRFLATQIKNDQLVGLVVIEPGRVRLLHAFTSSPVVLSTALQRVVGLSFVPKAALPVPSGRQPLTDEAPPEIEAQGLRQFVQQASEQMNRAIIRMNAQQLAQAAASTFESLRLIASWVAGIPGRKTMIWLTGQVPNFEPGRVGLGYNYGEDWERTFQSLANANMALYPVDVGGLRNTDFLPESASYKGPQQDQAANHSTMDALAKMTGGKAFYNSNDIMKSVARAADDSEHYYMLTYYLDLLTAKPGWHRLNVRVSRHGVATQARRGFLVATVKEDSTEARRAAEDLAAASPFDYTALPLTLKWKSITTTGDTRNVQFEVFTPAGAVFEGSDVPDLLSLDVITVATNAEGTTTTRIDKPIRRTLEPGAAQQIRNFGITYAGSLELKPGEYAVRLVVRDNLTGRLGSVTAPLQIAP